MPKQFDDLPAEAQHTIKLALAADALVARLSPKDVKRFLKGDLSMLPPLMPDMEVAVHALRKAIRRQVAELKQRLDEMRRQGGQCGVCNRKAETFKLLWSGENASASIYCPCGQDMAPEDDDE